MIYYLGYLLYIPTYCFEYFISLVISHATFLNGDDDHTNFNILDLFEPSLTV